MDFFITYYCPLQNSPALTRRSKSPIRSSGHSGAKTANSDKQHMFLINKMLYSSAKESEIKDTDEQTEYSLYSEAKSMNR